MNNLTQYSFSPISLLVEKHYNIDSTELDALALVYMVSGFTSRFAAMYILDNLGLGVGIFLVASLNLVGGWVRYYPGFHSYAWLLAGQCICAVAQSFLDIPGPKIAANWFPPEQRTTATAFASGPIFIALLFAYSMVPSLVKNHIDLKNFLLIEASLSTLAAILIFLIFRGNPPIPPSQSAAVVKMKWSLAVKILFTKLNFFLLFAVFSITIGVALAFSVLMDQIVGPAGYSNSEAGLLGTIWIASAIFGGAVGGPIIDKTHGYKAIMFGSIVLFTIAIAVFAVLLQFMQKNLVALSVVIAFIGLGSCGMPAILEATIETTYPVPEATAMGFMFLGLNITGILFTVIMVKLKNPKTGSMVPSLIGAVVLCVIACVCIVAFKKDYKRRQYEREIQEKLNKHGGVMPRELNL